MKEVVGGEIEGGVAGAREAQFAQGLEVGGECVVDDYGQVSVRHVLKVVMDGEPEGSALNGALYGDCACDG